MLIALDLPIVPPRPMVEYLDDSPDSTGESISSSLGTSKRSAAVVGYATGLGDLYLSRERNGCQPTVTI